MELLSVIHTQLLLLNLCFSADAPSLMLLTDVDQAMLLRDVLLAHVSPRV
jgi:hypothetical protein